MAGKHPLDDTPEIGGVNSRPNIGPAGDVVTGFESGVENPGENLVDPEDLAGPAREKVAEEVDETRERVRTAYVDPDAEETEEEDGERRRWRDRFRWRRGRGAAPAEEAGPEAAEEGGPEPAEEPGPEPTSGPGGPRSTPAPAEEAGPEPAEEAGPEPAEEAGPEPAEEAGPEPAEEAGPDEEAGPEPAEEGPIGPELSMASILEMTDLNEVLAAITELSDRPYGYYLVLGLTYEEASAIPEEDELKRTLRSALRKWGKKFHPDKHADTPYEAVADEIFKIVSRADSTLSVSRKRDRYNSEQALRRPA